MTSTTWLVWIACAVASAFAWSWVLRTGPWKSPLSHLARKVLPKPAPAARKFDWVLTTPAAAPFFAAGFFAAGFFVASFFAARFPAPFFAGDFLPAFFLLTDLDFERRFELFLAAMGQVPGAKFIGKVRRNPSAPRFQGLSFECRTFATSGVLKNSSALSLLVFFVTSGAVSTSPPPSAISPISPSLAENAGKR